MKKKIILKILLVIAAVAAIVAALPRTDRTTFSYEEGQPWRYTLLTAPFDIPIYLDSVTYKNMTDSVNANFSPYVFTHRFTQADVNKKLEEAGIEVVKIGQLSSLITKVYAAGVMPDDLKKQVDATDSKTVRFISKDDGNMANSVDASGMYGETDAFRWVVEKYETPRATFTGEPLADAALNQDDIDKIGKLLTPNITLDKENTDKYLELELQSINAGQGKIRQGQRIVDRGEIITPQIYRNLKTYEEMQAQNTDTEEGREITNFLAQLLYVIIVFSMLYLYLAVYRPKVFADLRSLTFMITLITLFVVLASLMFDKFTMGIYLTPFAMVPVMVLIFIDSRTAFMCMLTTVLMCVLIATYQFQFVISEIVTGFMAILSLNQLSRRSQLLRTSLIIFFSYSVMGVLLMIISGGELRDLDWHIFLAYGVNAVLFSLTYVLIVLIERVFGFTSTVTLVELSDINNPLLRRLAEEAPGTFQHSMQVSTLAADAAHAIGANTQLVRTGALYHDIGKIASPIFFTENQHGANPHNGLDPELSARKIISHVTEGISMAEKAKLPRIITSFIREHHGSGVTKYFYTVACNNSPTGEADKSLFTYPGPNPQSRETAVLMMADAVEAASRSLKEYTPENISDLVDKIIDSQIADGMFNESPISFADIDIIKDTFKKRLSTIYHTRVAYPKRKQKPEE